MPPSDILPIGEAQFFMWEVLTVFVAFISLLILAVVGVHCLLYPPQGPHES